MAIIRWNPWRSTYFLDDDWDIIPGVDMLPGSGQGLNIFETKNEVVAKVAMPGVPAEKIDITVREGVVHIHGSVEETQIDKSAKRSFMSSMDKIYNYAFRIPWDMVETTEPDLDMEDGVLVMTFPKVKGAKTKKKGNSKKT